MNLAMQDGKLDDELEGQAVQSDKPWYDGLTDKQRRFVEEYCKHKNGARAARDAGYAEGSDDEMAYENLRKPQILAAINLYLSAYFVSVGEATQNISDYARGSVAHFLKLSESGHIVINLAHNDAKEYLHLIKKIKQKVTTRSDDNGTTEDVWTEIELYDAMAANRLMLELHGKVITRTDLTTGGKPIPSQHRVIFEDYTKPTT